MKNKYAHFNPQKHQIRVLVACEESQRVCIAFRKRGFEAYSCDILPCSGGHPEWHIQSDVLDIIGNGDKIIITQNGDEHFIQNWDMLIAHPPCTRLAVSGARWFKDNKSEQKEAINFFMILINAPIRHKAIENPISIMSSKYRKPDQIIQPWMFGHGETKATCLWLFNLPKLISSNIVEGREARIHKMPPSVNRARERSITYQGVADAMAQQWGDFLLKEQHNEVKPDCSQQ